MRKPFKRWLKVVLGVAALTASTNVLAEFGCMSAPYGWYMELNAGSTHVSGFSYPGSISTSGIGGNINLGYKFMPYFGMEIGYSRYANSSVNDQFGTKAATIKHYSYDLALRGIFPISSSGFELFGKVGVQRNYANQDIRNTTAANNIGLPGGHHSDTGLYVGAGGQYYFFPEFAVNIQWQRADGNDTVGQIDLFSVGISYIFAD